MIDPQDVTAVLLAAGLSVRFGDDNKLMAPLDGAPLALHTARTIASLQPARLLAVCNAEDSVLCGLLETVGFEIVINPRPERGMSSSLACAIEGLEASPSAAVLICLADMPFVTVGHFRALLAAFDPDDAPVVASQANKIAMPPAVFAASHYEDLRTGVGDRGARDLIATARRVIASAEELADIDTPDDLPRRRP